MRKHQHQQLRAEFPGVAIVDRQVIDLSCTVNSKRRGGDVEFGQFLRRQFLEPCLYFVLYHGNFPSGNEGISDYRDVATLRGTLRTYGFAVEEAQAVGSRDIPDVLIIRPAIFPPWLVDQPHSWHKMLGHIVPPFKRFGEANVDLPNNRNDD